MDQSKAVSFTKANSENFSENDINYSSSYREYMADANNSEHAGILEDAAEKEIISRLKNIMQIPQSSVGLLFSSTQTLNDWHKLKEFGMHVGDWGTHLSRLIQKMRQESDVEVDRLQVKSVHNPMLRLLSKPPCQDFTATQKDSILAMRGLLIYRALIENKKPSADLIASFTKLLAKKTTYEYIADLDLAAITEYSPNSTEQDHEIFIYTLQKLFTKPLVDLANFVQLKTNSTIQIISSFVDSQSEEQKLQEEQSKTEDGNERKYKTDLVNYITYVQQFLGQKENVGINERYNYVQTFEIELIIPKIVEDLKEVSLRKLALATLLTLLLHCRPVRFGLIGLSPNLETTAWINLDNGCFCWELNAVTEKAVKNTEYKTSICIPLPEDVIYLLRQLNLEPLEGATNLGDLFNCDLIQLDSECKRYLQDMRVTSHRATLSRLEISYSRYVLNFTSDEVYAASIGLDFCIGTTSNFNYCVIRGNKLINILQEVYKKLGFSHRLLIAPIDVGSNTGLDYKKVWDFVESLSIQAYDIISTVPKNLTFQNLVETHNNLSASIASLVVIFTGHRAAVAYTFSMHTVDIERKLCLICDKRVTDYQRVRIVPIPNFIAQWLDVYFKWLESLKYRLSSVNKQLAFQVSAILESTFDKSYPLFFKISNNEIKPYSSIEFSSIIEDFNLPTNCGRHFINSILRDGGLDSANIMAFEGHANLGQESFGPTSLMSVFQVSEKIRDVIDQAISMKKLKSPPIFNPRNIDCRNLRFPKNKFVNLFADEYVVKNKQSVQCPFDERSKESLDHLISYLKKWTKTEGVISLSDLLYSLTIIDGIASTEELTEAINQTLNGEIFILDDNFFIDTVTKKLGVRRIWLSYGTILIAAAVAKEIDTKELKLDFSDATFKAFRESLVASVAMHYSVFASGMLAAWARGEVASRTTRHETLARHHFNCPEKTNFELIGSKRAQVLLDDDLIRKAINRACDVNQNLGTNQTRLKNLSSEIDRLLDFQIDEISIFILAKFTQYLISLQIATSSISRYYLVVRQFLDFFLDEITVFSQIDQIDWSDIVKNWVNTEQLDTDSGPETAAVNHFLTFVKSDIKIKCNFYSPNSAVLEYADFPSCNEISKSASYIKNNPNLDEATKLKAIVMIGLLSQYAIRPSEIRNIRVCDIFLDDPMHFVITSEAIGKVKTRNANRVLLLKEDEFLTKEHLAHLCFLKEGFPSEAFIFGDNIDGSTLDNSQILFNVVHDALSIATGHSVSIMSFRHFNITRDIKFAMNNAGIDALKDRKSLSVIAANSGHGHANTSLQNYCCDIDKQRYEFWQHHLCNQKLSAPISEIKKRMGMNFKGNLPLNHPSFSLLSQILRDDFVRTYLRIKDCHDFIINKDLTSIPANVTNEKHIAAPYKYSFYKFADADSELAIFESNILQREKYVLDQGLDYLKDALNKYWCDSQINKFRAIIQSENYSKLISRMSTMPMDAKVAVQLVQAINHLCGKWEIRNLMLLDFLERHIAVFSTANINLEISVNMNLKVDIRKTLRQKSFTQLVEKSMAHDIYCQVSFWDTNLKSSLRARHLQEVMLKVNIILLTKAALLLGELHE